MDRKYREMLKSLQAQKEQSAAKVFVANAFAEALLSGMDAGCVINAALATSFRELIALYGEERVAKFAESLPERIRGGEFYCGTLQ